jgi:cell division protein FtsX
MYAASLFGIAAAILALGGAANAVNVYESALLAALQSADGEEAYCAPPPPSLSPIIPLLTLSSPRAD